MDLNTLITNLKSRFFKFKQKSRVGVGLELFKSKQKDKVSIGLELLKPKQKNKTSIGLDLGFSSIKIVILERLNNTYILKDARIVELSPQDVNSSSVIKNLGLSQGINLGISGPNVIIRYIAMAKMDENEFKNSLRYEAVSHLPFPVEEVNLDGVMLKDLPDGQMMVMLAAAKKNFINQLLKTFQEAGIEVYTLDIDSLALLNAFNYTHSHPVSLEKSFLTEPVKNSTSPTGKPKIPNAAHTHEDNNLSGAVALLNVGALVTNINILENGIPHFSRDIDIAGRNFAKEDPGEVAIANFVSEIRKSFDYYEAESTTIINKIFLSGGGSLSPGLASNLEKHLGIRIEQWDPFSNFEFAPGLDEANIRKNSVRFAVAVGLALRS